VAELVKRYTASVSFDSAWPNSTIQGSLATPHAERMRIISETDDRLSKKAW